MKIIHRFGGGVYVKETHFEAGEFGEKHTHDFDHLSYLVSGTARLRVDEEIQILTGPMAVNVQAGKAHRVLALTDIVWLCVHATACTDPDQVDEKIMEAKHAMD